MAKKKNDENPNPSGKYNPADVADFVAELEGEMPTDESAAPEEHAPAPSTRKIKVETVADVPHQPTSSQPSVHNVPADLQPTSDMGTLTRAKRHFPWVPVISVVAVLAAASIAGFFFFNRDKKFSNANVQLQMKPVSAVTSGGPMTLTIVYQNLEQVDLTNAELTVQYPDGFTYTSSTPNAAQDYHNAFSLGTVRSGQSGTVAITGTLLGGVGESVPFSATLSYRPANFNSDFQQTTATQVVIGNSALRLTFDGPTQLAPGASGTWTVGYTNTSDHDLQSIQIALTYPDGFTVGTTTPATTDHATWSIPSVKQGASGKITFTGTPNGSIGDTFSFKAAAGLQGAGGVVQAQDTQNLLVILVKTSVTARVAVNGSTDPVTIMPGDNLNYSIQVANTSDIEMLNATLTAKIDGAAADLTTLANDTHATVTGSTLTWTANELAGLSDFKPGQAVTVSFGLGTQNAIPMKTDSDKNQKITVTVSLASGTSATSSSTNTNQASNTNKTANTNAATNSSATTSASTTSSQPIAVVVTKIGTVMALGAEARYYDDSGHALGSGPVPPVVGKATTYRVTLQLTNTTSDAGTVAVSAQLPNNVLWTGQNLSRDAGTLAFDSTTRTVQWTINTIPAGTGGRLPALTAHFDVAVTPTADQVGATPILLQTPTVTATDAYTNGAINVPTATVTTDIPNDPKVAHQGTVVAS